MSDLPAIDTHAKLSRYELREKLGQGATGTVYLAFDTKLQRQVAVKLPRVDADHQKGESDFLDEARSLAQLNHPGIVSVLDVGVDGDRCFIVSDYLPGPNLSDWLRKSPPTRDQAIDITCHLADALAHAHAHRVIHRDLKPANIIMTDGTMPVIVDFDMAISGCPSEGGARGKSEQRQKGVIAGTPAYMAPEQVIGEGHRIDGRTDIYSLGVILYQMLTRQLPFASTDSSVLMQQIREDEPQPPRQIVRDIPRELQAVCLKAMAKDFFDRFMTADDFADALRSMRITPSGGGTHSEIASQETKAIAADSSRSNGSQKGSSSQRSRRATRRRVTVVQFSSNLFESVEVMQSLELDEQDEVATEFRNLCHDIAAQFGGHVVQRTDQGVLVCFGFPTMSEDATQRAVAAALRLMEQTKNFNESLFRRKGITLSTKATIHSGLAVVAATENQEVSLSGRMHTVVAKIAADADWDTVVVTGATHRLVSGFFEFDDLGKQHLSGGDELKLYRAFSARLRGRFEVATSRGDLTPLIGREHEVGLLKERWRRARTNSGEIVMLAGEPGIGKSRLAHTLKQHVRSEFHNHDDPTDDQTAENEHGDAERGETALIIDWRSTEQLRNHSLHPIIESLEQILGFDEHIAPIKRLSKIVRYLDDIGLEGDEQVALIASLLSVPLAGCYPPLTLAPQQKKDKTFGLILEWLRCCAEERPLLLVVEDLHWVDPSTLQLLDAIVAHGLQERMLLLLTYRPEFEPAWPVKSHLTTVTLNRLSHEQTGQMIAAIAKDQRVPAAMVKQLAERTDGVPLFVEEFASVLEDAEALSSENVTALDVPATLHDLLTTRLERTSENLKVVQLGAAIGREFGFDLVAAVAELPEVELQAELDRLVAADLLYQRGFGADARYLFKHALIQDAAYDALVKKERLEIHRRIATVSETQFPEYVERHPDVAAHHFTSAECWDRAIDYWQRAAENATQQAAHQEASRHLRQALQLLEKLPENGERDHRELRLRSLLGVHLQAMHGYNVPQVEANYQRAHALCERLDDPHEQFPVLYGLFRYYMMQSALNRSKSLADQLLHLAEQTNLPTHRVYAHRAMGTTLLYQGELLPSRQHLEQVLAIEPTAELRKKVAEVGVVDPWVTSRSYLSCTLWLLGYPDQALAESDLAIEQGKALQHPIAHILPVGFSQWLHQFRGDVERTEATCRLSDQLGEDFGFPFWNAWTIAISGWIMDARGESTAAIGVIRDGIEQWQAAGSGAGCHYFFTLLAQAAINAGDFVAATTALAEADEFAERTGEHFYRSEIARMRGELVLRRANDDVAAYEEAESWFRESLQLASQAQSKSLELRAACSLARLQHAQGQAPDARETIQSVLDWFTEGLTTQDLRDAREIIDALDGEVG